MTLNERIDAAFRRLALNHAPMRIPADETDVDLVLSDCQRELARLTAALATAEAERDQLRTKLDDWNDEGSPEWVEMNGHRQQLLVENTTLRAQLAARQAALERVAREGGYSPNYCPGCDRHEAQTSGHEPGCYIADALTDSADPLPALRALWSAAGELIAGRPCPHPATDDPFCTPCFAERDAAEAALRDALAALPWLADAGEGK